MEAAATTVPRCHSPESDGRLDPLMQAPLEIRYAGVIIGRAQELRTTEGDTMYFLPSKEPMPVGTLLRLRSGRGEAPARVVRAVESPDPAVCGMEVRLVGEEEIVAPEFIPAPAPAKPKASPAPPVAPPPETPTPTQAVDVAAMEAEAAKLPPAPASESAAVPEAVPVAVGSSLTGALAKAAAAEAAAPVPEAASAAPMRTQVASDDLDIVITNTPPPISPSTVVPVVAPFEPEPAPAPAPAAETAVPASAVAAEPSQAAADDHAEENGVDEAAGGRTTEQMPTARAISGPGTRRKTKRRR